MSRKGGREGEREGRKEREREGRRERGRKAGREGAHLVYGAVETKFINSSVCMWSMCKSSLQYFFWWSGAK